MNNMNLNLQTLIRLLFWRVIPILSFTALFVLFLISVIALIFFPHTIH
ncbi:MAG: hypothetical protein MUE85_05310 [Microscillaceae bacterium]|jgi:hypothetical protein|nr:hypothetical protein [Microscillaceae bacterium]